MISEYELVDYKDLQVYEEIIKRAADELRADIIPNDNLNYAKIIIKHMFRTAERNIKILSGELVKNVYADRNILGYTREYFERKGKLEILLQNVEPENFGEFANDHPFVKLCKQTNNSCDIRLTNADDKSLLAHFVTMDDRAFRFCNNKNYPTAIASFNHPPAAANLSRQFDKMFGRATICNF